MGKKNEWKNEWLLVTPCYTLSLVPFHPRNFVSHSTTIAVAVFFVCLAAYFTVKPVRFSFSFLRRKLFVVCPWKWSGRAAGEDWK